MVVPKPIFLFLFHLEKTTEKKTEHNSKWLNIPDHSYRIFMIEGPGSGKRMHY